MKIIITILLVALPQLFLAQTNPKEVIADSTEIDKKITTISAKTAAIFDALIEESLLKATESKKQQKPKHITFLLEITSEASLNKNKILLEQALKLLSKKAQQQDKIAIVTFSRSNAIVLQPTAAKNKKVIIKALNNIAVNNQQVDLTGIDKAYQLAEDHYAENGENIVFLLRDDTIIETEDVIAVVQDDLVAQETMIKKQQKTTILVTALSLIPEIIRIIK